jgi:hypothetical protein
MQMDAVGAVGCYQSHVRCWEWLIANGTAYPYALIVEDDACLSHRFAREFNDHVVPLLLQPGPDALDFCVLGYRLVRGGVTPRRTHHRGVAVFDRCCWEGGHCYAVTRRGATVLRRLAYPMQVHVDMLLGLTMELGCARGVVWPASLATQCVGWWERGIGHLDWGVGVKKFVADVTLPEAVIPVGFLLVLCVVAALRLRTRKRNDDAPGRSGPLRTDTG